MAVIGQTVYEMELQFWDINISSLKYKEIYKKYVPDLIRFFSERVVTCYSWRRIMQRLIFLSRILWIMEKLLLYLVAVFPGIKSIHRYI